MPTDGLKVLIHRLNLVKRPEIVDSSFIIKIEVSALPLFWLGRCAGLRKVGEMD